MGAMHGRKSSAGGASLSQEQASDSQCALCNPWHHLHEAIAVTASFLSVFAVGMASDSICICSILCLPDEILCPIADESISEQVNKPLGSTLTGPHKLCNSSSASHNSSQWDVRSRPLSAMHGRVYKAKLPSRQLCRIASVGITESHRSGARNGYPQDRPSPL